MSRRGLGLRPSTWLPLAALTMSLLLVAPGADAARIIAYGDSITAGFGDDLAVGGYPPRLHTALRAWIGPTVEVVNHGRNGERTDEALSRIEGILDQGGDYMLLMEGTNDVFRQVSTETIAFNLSELASRAAARGIPTMYATLIPQKPSAEVDPNNIRTSALAQAIRDLGVAQDRAVVDPFAVFLNTPNVFNDYYYQGEEDPVGHPNARGYDLLMTIFRSGIQTRRIQVGLDLTEGQSLSPPTTITGWSFDPLNDTAPGVDLVQFWVSTTSTTPFVAGTASIGLRRDDVAALYGESARNSGFSFNLLSGVPSEPGSISGHGRSTATGALNGYRDVAINFATTTILRVDNPVDRGFVSVPFTISGFAIDRRATTGTGIDQINLWAFPRSGSPPTMLGIAGLGFNRPEVSNAYGPRYAPSGYSYEFTGALTPGMYDIRVYARSTFTGGFDFLEIAENVHVVPTPRCPQSWHDFFAVDTRETPYVGDFDGDGKTDIVTFTRSNPVAIGDVYVALAGACGYGPSAKWHDWLAISAGEDIAIGDFNGDGKDDIATWLRSSTRQVYVGQSTGTGLQAERLWLGPFGQDTGDLLYAADADGDGRDDLVMFERSRGRVEVARSLGSSFASPEVWHSFFAVSTYERPRVGDLDGDGRSDILTFATNSPTAYGDVYVAKSTGSRFSDGVQSTKWHDFFSVEPSQIIRIGDLDGDGRDDLFTFMPATTVQVYVARSEATHMGPNELIELEGLMTQGSQPFVGDADGDGLTDVIVFDRVAGKVRVYLDINAQPRLLRTESPPAVTLVRPRHHAMP